MIYDCFIFSDELDLLEIRLNELQSIVDRFVLVESPKTFSGQSKSLHYSDSKKRFAPFSDKIIHVVVDDFPQGLDDQGRENFLRDAVSRGLSKCQDDDIVIISDMDEIPHPKAIRAYQPQMGLRSLEQKLFYYFLNCEGGLWIGSRILTFQLFKKLGGASIVHRTESSIIKSGGWRFAHLGGSEATRESNVLDHMVLVATAGVDLPDRKIEWKLVPLDNGFPNYIQKNRSGFAKYIKDAEFNEKWYSGDQLQSLVNTYRRVTQLKGAIIEIGCWEGKSTIALANTCHPETLIAVDTWMGNIDESPDHVTTQILKTRDVYATFCKNMKAFTKGNVQIVKQDCHEFLARFKQPIKFCHVDASHDYQSVKKTLDALLPNLVTGGVLCGDDFQSAGVSRTDLEGGVERAVRETLPGFHESINNFWLWQKP